MSNLVIVAIPAEDDYVNRISSEKTAHMTLLFLGEADKVKNLNLILDFVKFSCERSLPRFGMEVDRRGTLGPDQSDVLFFAKSRWSGFDSINNFRSYLLKNDNIRKAYDSAEQFPEWIPHLTLGNPDAPAKLDGRDYPGTTHVNFDRIGVWFGDFEGIEFSLKAPNWDMGWDMNLAWSDIPKALTENILSHYGKKGMKWGIRNFGRGGRSSKVTVVDKRKKLKTSGGSGRPAHSDAVRARTLGQVGKKSGLKALSDKELTDYSKRLQLEASVKRLNYNEKNIAKKFVATILGQAGKNTAQNVANDVAAGQVKKHLGRKLVTIGATAAVG